MKLSLFPSYLSHLLSRKKILAGSLLLCFAGPSLAGWEVQWIDKFDGEGVNWDNWTAQTEANYNNEDQCYTDDDSSDEKNYDVSDGTLKIIARKQSDTYRCEGLDNSTSKTWTSGRLNSKDKAEFLYGRVESRIRFSPDEDLLGGTWPAFWMLENRINQQPFAGDGDYINWPSAGAGEIDVWEWFSNSPDSYITNFFNTESCGSRIDYSYPNGSVDVQNWHRYAMEWTEDEISLLRDNNVNIVLCPESNMKLASGFCPVAELMEAGINVALGTDGAASNNDLDLFGELKTAALLTKAVAGDPAVLDAHAALRIATINGAKALGWDDEIGSLEAGKSADIIAIEINSIAQQPLYNPASQLVYTNAGSQVTHSWVAGKPLLDDRILCTLNNSELIQSASDWRNKIQPKSMD